MDQPVTMPEILAALRAQAELRRTLHAGLRENMENRQRLLDRIRKGSSHAGQSSE